MAKTRSNASHKKKKTNYIKIQNRSFTDIVIRAIMTCTEISERACHLIQGIEEPSIGPKLWKLCNDGLIKSKELRVGTKIYRINAQGIKTTLDENYGLGARNQLRCDTYGWTYRGGDKGEIQSIHNARTSEVVVMMDQAGIKSLALDVPRYMPEQVENICGQGKQIFSSATNEFITRRTWKLLNNNEHGYTNKSKCCGLLVSDGNIFNVYNYAASMLKNWLVGPELKAQKASTELIKIMYNANELTISKVDQCIILGEDTETAKQIVMNYRACCVPGWPNTQNKNAFCYQRMLYVPLSNLGVRMLRIITSKGWMDACNAAAGVGETYKPVKNHSYIDGMGDGVKVSVICGDIHKMFGAIFSGDADNTGLMLYCFEHELPYVKAAARGRKNIRVKSIKMEEIESILRE